MKHEAAIFPLKNKLKWKKLLLGQQMFDKIELPVVRLQKKGRRILFVIDRVHNEDMEAKRLLGSVESSKAFDSCLDLANRDLDGISEYACINMHCFRIVKLSPEQQVEALKDFFKRVMRYADKYQPDIIVFMGKDSAGQAWGQEFNYHDFGRIKPFKYNDKEYTGLCTLPLLELSTSNPKFMGKFPNLFGVLVRDFETAIRGKNLYTIDLSNTKTIIIRNMEQFEKFYKKLWKARTPSIDIEATSLNKVNTKILSIQFTFDGITGYFLPMDHMETPFTGKELKYIKEKLKYYFEFGKSDYLIYQNGKFDLTVKSNMLDIRFINHDIYDTQAGEYTLDENRMHINKAIMDKVYSLSCLERQYGYIRSGLAVDKDDRHDMTKFSIEEMAPYGVIDVFTPYWISNFQRMEARRRGPQYSGFLKVVSKLISSIIHCFIGFEKRGVFIDKDYLMSQMEPKSTFRTLIKEHVRKINKMKNVRRANDILLRNKRIPKQGLFGDTSWVFNINRPEARDVLFFQVMKLDGVTGDSGRRKTDKKFQKIYKEHKEVDALIKYNKMTKLFNTYVKGIWNQYITDEDVKIDGALRSYYDYLFVRTGRASSRNPNYHSIPTREDKDAKIKMTKLIKRMFVARRGHVLFEKDYSAHEVRNLGNVSGDQKIIDTFNMARDLRRKYIIAETEDEAWILKELETKGDIHIMNVKFFFGLDVDKNHPLRSAIKAVVFGVMYGKGPAALADDIKDTVEKAKELIAILFKNWNVADDWLKATTTGGQVNFYVTSPLGRVRHLAGYHHYERAVHAAMNRRSPNSIIQGSSSDIGFLAGRQFQIQTWELFTKQHMNAGFCLNNAVHDALKGYTPIIELPIAEYLLNHSMTTLVHKQCREDFGWTIACDFETGTEFGPHQADQMDYNGKPEVMIEGIKKSINWQKENYGWEYDEDRILSAASHNLALIDKLRVRETEMSIEYSRKHPYRSSEIMLLDKEIARNIGFKLQVDQGITW